DRLQRFLDAQLHGAGVRIDGLRRTSAGFSRENWVFDASWRDADGVDRHERLIMRRDPVGSVLDTDRRVEFGVLRALEHTAVPAPRVRWLDADGEWLGRPSVVMVREEGVCDWFVLSSDRPLADRVAIGRRFVELLATIHTLDWRRAGVGEVLDDPGPDASLVALDHWERELRRHQVEPHPELEVVAAWLRANAPRSQTTVLVHGDFKPGNALMRGDHVHVMLDWETAHLGDPIEDVGWITNPVRAREHQIPGAWERDQIVEHYAKTTGFTVDPDALRWWNVLANYKLAVIVLTGIAAFVDGRFDRIHQAPVNLARVMFGMIGA
ncbi:MAG TPA: phosphotransferase family protein, partial [Acidimicrobiales bacterium]